jgi:hypothetical protein
MKIANNISTQKSVDLNIIIVLMNIFLPTLLFAWHFDVVFDPTLVTLNVVESYSYGGIHVRKQIRLGIVEARSGNDMYYSNAKTNLIANTSSVAFFAETITNHKMATVQPQFQIYTIKDTGDSDSAEVFLSWIANCTGGSRVQLFVGVLGAMIIRQGTSETNYKLGDVSDGSWIGLNGYIQSTLLSPQAQTCAKAKIIITVFDKVSPKCPDHDPASWDGVGAPNFQELNNCYNYATSHHTNSYAQPGRGGNYAPQAITVDEIRTAAISDGLIPVDSPNVSCLKGGCLVALVVSSGTLATGDFHWLRQGYDGNWSHKPGQSRVSYTDDNGQPIVDPTSQRIRARDPITEDIIHDYADWGGYFCAPHDANVRKMNLQNVNSNQQLETSEDVYFIPLINYGLPNPVHLIADSAKISALCDKLKNLSEADSAIWENNNQQYSYYIHLPEFDGPIFIRDSLIAIYDWTDDPHYYLDTYGLKSWLNDLSTQINLQTGKVANIPDEFALLQNYPNPFNFETIVKYQVPKSGKVTIQIYDVLGRQVRTLVNTDQHLGHYELRWDGKDYLGKDVSSGVYLYRLETNNILVAKKMVLMR